MSSYYICVTSRPAFILFCSHPYVENMLPYSWKYWWSIKFGGLAVGEATVKFKCDLRIYVLFYACVHIICTELPPNLNPPIFLFRPLGTKPPNVKIANISGYTGVQFGRNYCPKHKTSCHPLIAIFCSSNFTVMVAVFVTFLDCITLCYTA